VNHARGDERKSTEHVEWADGHRRGRPSGSVNHARGDERKSTEHAEWADGHRCGQIVIAVAGQQDVVAPR
jgi:hypothetical protein